MNKVVQDCYPASKLPDDLRGSIDRGSEVTVVVIEREKPQRVMSLEELFALRRPPYLSAEEIDNHIRELRDEWDDR